MLFTHPNLDRTVVANVLSYSLIHFLIFFKCAWAISECCSPNELNSSSLLSAKHYRPFLSFSPSICKQEKRVRCTSLYYRAPALALCHRQFTFYDKNTFNFSIIIHIECAHTKNTHTQTHIHSHCVGPSHTLDTHIQNGAKTELPNSEAMNKTHLVAEKGRKGKNKEEEMRDGKVKDTIK